MMKNLHIAVEDDGGLLLEGLNGDRKITIFLPKNGCIDWTILDGSGLREDLDLSLHAALNWVRDAE